MSDSNNSVRSADHQRQPQSRREALAAVGKFAAFVAPATAVLLSADQAKAVPNCSNDPNGVKGQNCP